jgi:hypothetical protein
VDPTGTARGLGPSRWRLGRAVWHQREREVFGCVRDVIGGGESGGRKSADGADAAPAQSFTFSAAFDVNAHSVRVGTAEVVVPSGNSFTLVQYGMRWDSDGSIHNLNTLIHPSSGWTILRAMSINDSGQILARAKDITQNLRNVLLTPIPAAPMVALTVNQASFSPGQTLTVTIQTQDAAGYDLCVGAIMPDGDQLLLLARLSPVEGQVVRLSTTHPAVFPKMTAGAKLTQTFSHTFTGLETPGTYHLVAALVPPGAFQDGVIHGEALVGLDWKAISLQVTPLHAKMLAIRDRHMSQ